MKLLSKVGNLVDAVSYRNTVKVAPVVRHPNGAIHPAFTGRQFAGLSGPCTFQMTVGGVKDLVEIRERLNQQFRIISVGGVSTVDHVVQLRSAGADVVQVCTSAMFDPLLAWKVRFHLSRFETPVSVQPTQELLEPRDLIERESRDYAIAAFAEIQRRYPTRPIAYSVFVDKWNNWIIERPPVVAGRPHRMPARTFEQWMREFSR